MTVKRLTLVTIVASFFSMPLYAQFGGGRAGDAGPGKKEVSEHSKKLFDRQYESTMNHTIFSGLFKVWEADEVLKEFVGHKIKINGQDGILDRISIVSGTSRWGDVDFTVRWIPSQVGADPKVSRIECDWKVQEERLQGIYTDEIYEWVTFSNCTKGFRIKDVQFRI